MSVDAKRLVTDAEAAALRGHVAEPCGGDHTEALADLLDTREALIEEYENALEHLAALPPMNDGEPCVVFEVYAVGQRLLSQLRGES